MFAAFIFILKCIISWELWKQLHGFSLPCVSFLKRSVNRERNETIGPSQWRWLLHRCSPHTDYWAESWLLFYWKQYISYLLHGVLPSFHTENSSFCQTWCPVTQKSRVLSSEQFNIKLLTLIFDSSLFRLEVNIPKRSISSNISKAHSIILYTGYFLNSESLKPDRLRLLEWFPFSSAFCFHV